MSHTLKKSLLALSATAVLASAAWAHETPGVQKQDSQAAMQADVQHLAVGLELPYGVAAQAIAFQEEFAAYVENLSNQYPNQISRIWRDPAPAKKGYIEFVGQVPPINPMAGVHFLANGLITQMDHSYRAELAAQGLKEAGFRNFATFFDPVLDKIYVEMMVPQGAPQPQFQTVLQVVQQKIWLDQQLFGAALEVAPHDLHLGILVSDDPIYAFDHTRGGNWLLDDSTPTNLNRECTSGWVVEGPDGDGIVTAGHCNGLNEFEEANGTIFDIDWQDQELDKGDAEYHTSPTHIDLHEFWASSTELRDVESTKATLWMSVGDSVCVYGRSSNVRVCTHTIDAKNVTVVYTGGLTIRKLVRMNGDSTIGGDSGGGWSWGTKAWGVHSGSSTGLGTRSYFTPIRRVEKELNVDVKLAPLIRTSPHPTLRRPTPAFSVIAAISGGGGEGRGFVCALQANPSLMYRLQAQELDFEIL